MKLRLRENSLRLRLLRGEVEQFGQTGRVVETIRFGASPDAHLSYVLEADGEARQITTHFSNNLITVKIPAPLAKNWVETEQVALKAEQPIENGKQNASEENGAPENVLKILIEKDFVCLDRKDDPDNADAFPHPSGKCV
jgi:hypothetical protein